MNKVWVPIDLPEGARVRDIIVELGPGGPAHTRGLEPLGPVRRFEEDRASEPQRERWEYDYIDWHNTSNHAAERWRLNQLGSEGWEAYHAGDVTWFKRRLA